MPFNFKAILIAIVTAVGVSANAADNPATATTGNSTKLKDAAMKAVPNAKLLTEDGNDFDLQTAKGTIVEVEMNGDGSLDEASGDAATQGDVFSPGNGLISLEEATRALQKAGKSPTGDWSLEKSMLRGWVYEFEGRENGKDMEYAIDAKTGKLVKDRRDLM